MTTFPWRGAVIVPVYRSELTKDELTSVEQLFKVLGSHKIVVLCPDGLKLPKELWQCEAKRFPTEFFKGIDGYNNLMMSSSFYRQFEQYQDILIHQLDCLVFRDELSKWSAKGFSYVAPPWFGKFWNDPKLGLWRVGNGGFSLRRVSSALSILGMKVPAGTMKEAGERAANSYVDPANASNHYRSLQEPTSSVNVQLISVEEDLREYPLNEDLFWSFEAPLLDAEFKIPSAKDALSFAFEKAPRWCYRKNWWRLPMGCHAWGKEDRAFWIKHLS
jgi:Protein of unknown function (DUF5672)